MAGGVNSSIYIRVSIRVVVRGHDFMLTCLIGEWIDFKLDTVSEPLENLQLVSTVIILVKLGSITPSTGVLYNLHDIVFHFL